MNVYFRRSLTDFDELNAIVRAGFGALSQLNSGEMSGLACCRPDVLYSNLHRELVRQGLERVVW